MAFKVKLRKSKNYLFCCQNKSKYRKMKRIKNFLFVSFDFFKNELM